MVPKFTIIIPHHNIPDLLLRCLESIPKREDVQVIIVDDNSEAEKVDFIHFPGSLGMPIEGLHTEIYFSKEGLGAGYARNIGLKHAKGKWLLFADADDVFCIGVSEAFAYLEKTKADLVYFQVESRDCFTLKQNNEAAYQNEICDKFLGGNVAALKYHHEVPWGKAILREVVEKNSIRFDELYCGNDSLFSIKCDHFSQKTEVQKILMYCWMSRSGSLWHTPDDRWFRTRFISRIHIVQFLNSVGVKSAWNEERLKWYLISIKYQSAWDYICHHWTYAFACHHYFILVKAPIDRLRIWVGAKLNKM